MNFRTPNGGRIDRRHLITFCFDGKTYQGCRGDTLASALLANGIHLVGRSFKYHRPRGILSAGAEEPNALVGEGEPACSEGEDERRRGHEFGHRMAPAHRRGVGDRDCKARKIPG